MIQKYNETNGDEVAIQSELEEYNEQQNPGSKVLDYMMSMGLVITSTYYTSETLSRRKHNKGKHEQKEQAYKKHGNNKIDSAGGHHPCPLTLACVPFGTR